MSELEELLRDTARRLLAEEEVELIIGYEQGTLPLRTTPCFVRDPDEVSRLVWDVGCENNLATYLHHVSGKVGIVAKGCDGRSIVSEIVERQISRDNVVIIGVPCHGVIDRSKIEARLDGREVLAAELAGEQLVVRGTDFEETLEIAEVLSEGCSTCRHRSPPLYDVLVGEPSEAGQDGDDAAVTALEAQTPDERWAYFSREFSRCIRCYACRQACPSCYCPECFVDHSQPSWFGKSDDPSDVMAFHLVRAYHLAGRCLDCGACSRACPMNIDLRALRKKLQKDVLEMFGYEAGLDPDTEPALATFRPDDPQEFIK
jgi:formate dehydrogenase subunit beta